jgi:hypothetical protein
VSAPADRDGGVVTAPTAGWRFAAVAVLAGLAAVAGYAMFSGPTTLPSNAPPRVAPARPAPPAPPNEERQREGDGRND